MLDEEKMPGDDSEESHSLKDEHPSAHLKAHEERFALIKDTIRKSTMADDALDSAKSTESVIRRLEMLREFFNEFGMSFTKLMSNEEKVLDDFPEAERAITLNLERVEEEASQESGKPVEAKPLGLNWNSQTDEFTLPRKIPIPTRARSPSTR